MSDIDKLTDTYSKAIENLRGTSKWILSVFAAVAGVLVAGLQLTNLSKVEPLHLAISAFVFLVALAAVLVVVWMTVKVLGSGTVNDESLRQIAAESTDVPLNDTILLGGYKTVDDFLLNYNSVSQRYLEAEKKDDRATITELKDLVARLDYHLDNLLVAAKYAMVWKSYKQAIKWLFGCASVAAIAIGVFAWATGQKTVPLLILQSPPSAASLTLTTSGKQMLKDSLGQQCVEQATIPVILLSIQDGKFDVVTTPSAKCRVSKFSINVDIGTVKSTPEVEMP